MKNEFERIADLVEAGDESASSYNSIHWKACLLRSEAGMLKPLLANAITILTHAPRMAGVIKLDGFASKIMLVRPAPWDSSESSAPRLWTGTDDIRAAEWLQRQGVAVNTNVATQAVTAVAEDHKYHPVLEYLDKQKWDGTPRLSTWMTAFLGVSKSAYHCNVSRCSLIAAVARVRNPGCKVDTVPILEGAQGLGKSSMLKTLFDPWTAEEIADLGSKDSAVQLRGARLIEISELDAMSRADVGRIKAFISRTTDRYRPPYESRVIEQPRSCVFWGTTNTDNYLKDETGGRRFWPVATKKVDIEGIQAIRDQLWAEAQHCYGAGEKWWFEDSEILKAATEQQNARYVGDPWDLIVEKFVLARQTVAIDEILTEVIKLAPGQWGQVEQNRVSRCLRSLGFERYQARTGKARAWRYRRPPI